MQTYFDPYYHWLGIWPHEQPADHYRLLGLPRFEGDLAKIAIAADQRLAHVHQFQFSAQGAWSQRVLSELTLARTTLLDPVRKTTYDALLVSMIPAVIADGQPPISAATSEPSWPVETVRPAEPPASPVVIQVVSVPAPAPITASTPARGVPTGPMPIPIQATTPVAPTGKRTPGELVAGAMVERFRILEKIIASSLANVYKVQDTRGGRLYFLKLLPPAAAKNPEVRKRFQREIEIVTKLDHPNLIAGRETGTHEGQPFLLMDYVVGADLGTLVQQQGRLSVEDAVSYISQTARALGQLHLNGIYHRNLKPQVLLVDVQGKVRITNLLLAKIGEHSSLDGGDEALTTQGEQMGTFDYLSPEQATDPRNVDGRTDLYALGCTLFFLLVGRPPYIAKKPMEKLIAHRKGEIPSLRNLRDDVPEWLDAIFRKLLAKAPADRYQNVAELLAKLERGMPEVAGKPKSWWKKLLAAVGLR